MQRPAKTNPFPGLRPFESDEGYLYFGCEEQSEDVAKALLRRRLVAVVGPSGSGKSSLVRAGLLPFLKGGRLPGAAATWRIAMLRPGENPIHSLAEALSRPDALGRAAADAETANRDATLLEVRLKRSGLGLIDVVRLARLEPDQRILIVLDQFEELFRYAGLTERHSDAAAFVKLILEATRQSELPIYVVLTMRSDFIGDCAQFRDLPETVAAGLYLIPRLTREQRRTAIEKPVEVAGGEISQRLVNRVLNDVSDDPDQLPVMQHALMRTWDHWQKRQSADGDRNQAETGPIDLDDYLQIGGAAHALSKHAEEAFAELDENGRLIAQRMFQCLTEKGPDNREVRRPTRIATIAEIVGAPAPEVIGVVNEYRRPERSFLTPAASIALDADSVIDISHESLIRHWSRLSNWVNAEAESAKSYRHLAETAALHEQGRAGLWGDPDLAEYLKWQADVRPTRAWAERYHGGFDTAIKFLEQSRLARDAAARFKRLLQTAAAVALVLVIASLAALTTYAFIQRDAALRKEQEANEARKDVAQVARVSRRAHSESREGFEDSLVSLLDWAPPTWSAYLYRRRANVRGTGGDFAAARKDIDEAMRLAPDYLPSLVSSSDMYVIEGNAEGAVKDARAYLNVVKTNASAYGNLILGEAMRLKYQEAIRAIDDALANIQLPTINTESLVAPDIQRLTYNFQLSAFDSDFLVALRYAKAGLYAMSGDDRFERALEEADRSDDDYPFSRDAYLLALNWVWIIVRGQELHNRSDAGPEISHYGAYAIEGALWDRIARTRPGYREWADLSYRKFQNEFRQRPANHYRFLDRWAAQQLSHKQPLVVPDDLVLEQARHLALQADEVKKGASSLTRFVELADSHEKLSQAIKLLQDKEATRIGRREKDLLVRLLIQRSELRLQGDDKGGAREDASRVIEINPNLATAYRLLAAAAFAGDEKTKRENIDRAFALAPYDARVLADRASLVEPDNPGYALELLQKRLRVANTWSADYLRMARLQSRLGLHADALHNIDLAISTAPWRLDLFDERRSIETALKVDKDLSDLHYVESLHKAAAFQARTGSDTAAALQVYVRTFKEASHLSQTSEDAQFELKLVMRDLTGLLIDRHNAKDAQEFWRSLSKDPTLDSRQQQLALTEADRLASRSK
jgi:energy-coupling factor transporter ATP-binding protein EcfA2